MNDSQQESTENHALEAITAAGGVNRVAAEFGISRPAVRKWADTGRIPPERVLRVCQLGNNAVKPHKLAPLVYPVNFVAPNTRVA